MHTSLFIFALFVAACIAGTSYEIGLVNKTIAHPYYNKGSPFGFTVNGEEGKHLVLLKGETYHFLPNGTGTFVLVITSDHVGGINGVPYTNGVSGNGSAGGNLTFVVPEDAPADLYYHAKVGNYVGYRLQIVDNLCSAGFYRLAGTNGTCLRCLAGMYSDPYATKCKPCPVGTYSTGRGNTSCVTCPAGTFSPGGSATCEPCPAGRYSGLGSPACEPCPPGTYSNVNGSRGCTPCEPGYKSCAGATACSACPVGTTHAIGMFACKNCEAGTYNDAVGTSTCTPCPADYWSGNGASACTPCPPDTWSAAGTNTKAGCFPATFKK